MTRETVSSLVGLSGIALAGATLLWATSAPFEGPTAERAPGAVAAPGKGGKAPPKVPPKAPGDLVTRRGVPPNRPQPPEGAANVVLITVSAWRRDQLSPYGGPAAATPWLATLAEQGARFDDTIAAGGWSRPAIASITTGWHALPLGLHDEVAFPSQHALPDGAATLAQHLAQAGWYTMGVNAVPHTARNSGLTAGFDHFRDAHPQGYNAAQRLGASAAVDAALELLDARSGPEKKRPFFLQLELLDPHKPIQVPPEELEPFAGDGPVLGPYRSVLKRVDDALARLDATLAQEGLTEDTYVVVVGAIGEGLKLPEHHGHAHGRNLYPSTASVPWLVRGPGVGVGARVTGVSSQLDVTPTVLGLLGLPWAGGDGLDWSAQLASGGATTRAEAIADTWYYAANRAAIYTSTTACVRDFGSGPQEGEDWQDGCYDRLADPEFTTIIEAPELMAKLTAWREDAVARIPEPPKPKPPAAGGAPKIVGPKGAPGVGKGAKVPAEAP